MYNEYVINFLKIFYFFPMRLKVYIFVRDPKYRKDAFASVRTHSYIYIILYLSTKWVQKQFAESRIPEIF